MSESTFSPEAIDLAWKAANGANQAFDRMRGVGQILSQLRAVDHLGLAGVSIAEDTYSTLESQRESAQSDFDLLTRMAAPIMLAADSPFATPADTTPEVGTESWRAPQRVVLDGDGIEHISHADYETLLRNLGERGITATRYGNAGDKASRSTEEQLFNFGAAARAYEEMAAFAERRGYSQSLATRTWNAVFRAGTIIDVPDLAAYEARAAGSPPEELTSIRIVSPHCNERDGSHHYIDINTLYRDMTERPRRKSNLGVGVAGFSFLADYINHALPGIEQPLTVNRPPEQRAAKPASSETTSEPPELLDVVRVEGEDREFVTHLAVKRFLMSKGYTAQQLSALPALFRSLAHTLDPSIGYPDYNRQPASENLTFVGAYKTAGTSYATETWGIAPQQFITLMEEIESSPPLRDRLAAYTDFSRPLVLDYIAALRELTDHQDGGQIPGH